MSAARTTGPRSTTTPVLPSVAGAGRSPDALDWAVWGLLLVAAAGTVALMFAPVVLEGTRLAWLSAALRDGWAPLCHQQASRSFHVGGVPLLACARCTSIFAGATAGVVVAPLVGLVGRVRLPPRWLLAAALVPMALDAGLGIVGAWEGPMVTRAATGALAGFVAALFLVPGSARAAREIFAVRGKRSRTFASSEGARTGG